MTVQTRGAELVGRTLGGRYRLLSLIGTGASAGVYLAEDTSLRRRVAVKVLHPGLAQDAAFQKRFRAEARSAAALSHPHIMAVHDWGEADGDYLVTELLEGGSLRDLLATGSRLSLSQALLVGLHTAQGLAHAHRQGFVHRDIKPANLLFDRDGRLRIADFGIARAVAEAAWTEPEGVLVGTARYAAPEQAAPGPVDGRADVYSLALTLVEAVTGEVPLVGDTPLATMVVRQSRPIPVPDELGPLAEPLRRAGAHDPADRSTAEELVSGLLAAATRLSRPAALPLPGLPIVAPGTSAADRTETLRAPAVDDETGFLPLEGDPAPGADEPGGEASEPSDGAGPGVPPTTGTPGPAADARPDDATTPADAAATGTTAAGAAATTEATGTAAAGSAAAAGSPPTAGSHPSTDPVPASPAGAVTPPGEVDVDVEVDGGDGGPTVEGGRRRRRWPWVALVVLLVVAGGAGATWQYLRTRTPSYEVGTYVGAPVDDVRAEAAANDWVLVEAVERRDGTAAGEVIDQQPAPGVRLEEGESLAVVVSEGQVLRTVPSLGGLPQADAAAALEGAELAVGAVTEQHHEEVPAGHVVSASAEEGAQLETGTGVDLVISSGPEPRTIPELAGQPAADAVAALEGIGLVASVVEEYDTQVPEGQVISVSPGPGEQVERGATVEVTVSLGRPFVTVPDVVGLSAAEASDRLEAAGFVVVDTIGPPNRPVLVTDPPAGESRRLGQAITIVTRAS